MNSRAQHRRTPAAQRRRPPRAALLVWWLLCAGCLAAEDDWWRAVETPAYAAAQPSPEVVANLCSVRDSRIVPVLKRLYPLVAPRDRHVVAFALAEHGDASGRDLLTLLLGSANPVHAASAAAGLEKLGDENGRLWLTDRLYHGAPDWAGPCTTAIVSFDLAGRASDLERLVRNPRTEDAWREYAVAALVRLRRPDAEIMADKLLRDARSPERLVALLGATGRADLYPSLARSWERWGRTYPLVYLQAFAQLGDERAIVLLEPVRDAGGPAGRAATLALAALGERRAVDDAVEAVKRAEADEWTGAAAGALARCPDPRLAARLERIVSPAGGEGRLGLVCTILMARRDEPSRAALARLWTGAPPAAREAMLERALARPGPGALALLGAAWRDAEAPLRTRIAAAGLAAAHPQPP